MWLLLQKSEMRPAFWCTRAVVFCVVNRVWLSQLFRFPAEVKRTDEETKESNLSLIIHSSRSSYKASASKVAPLFYLMSFYAAYAVANESHMRWEDVNHIKRKCGEVVDIEVLCCSSYAICFEDCMERLVHMLHQSLSAFEMNSIYCI